MVIRLTAFIFIPIWFHCTYETSAVDAELFVWILGIDGAARAVQNFAERVDQSVGLGARPTA